MNAPLSRSRVNSPVTRKYFLSYLDDVNSYSCLKIRWWNINGRWPLVNKEFLKYTDILFLSETHLGKETLKVIPGFGLICNPDYPLISTHGGLAVYISDSIFQHAQNIRFSNCSVSFNLDFATDVSFMGVYIYPYDSSNFSLCDFGTLSNDIAYWLSNGITPFIG